MNKFIVLLLTFFIISCGVKPIEENDNLEGDWELITLNGNKNNSEKPIILHFNDNKIWGYAGCNSMNGIYQTGDNLNIKFDKLSSTRMRCEDKQMQIEGELFQALETTNRFALEKNVLMLNIGQSTLATFQRVINKEIVGKYWKLIELDGEKVSMVDNQEKGRFFTLKSDGTFHGFAGCNTMNGTYQLNGDKQIHFDDNLAITMRACPDVELVESDFLKVFETADNYTISDDKLYLNVGKKMPLAVFEAVYF